MTKWEARLRAEVQMVGTIEANPADDVYKVAADRMRSILPPLPDGLEWVVFTIDLHRVEG